ncbi:MAG: hypothetical protein Q4P08_04925 [Eubacteriales bacterium]|nr:hypothetical protein [Eubacteriales bacterium]
MFLLGKGIAQSVSPEIHNDLLRKANLDYEYGLVDLERDQLPALIQRVKAEDIWGFNVTSPYKAEILNYLDSIDQRVEVLGAVNTVVQRAGKLYGYNTDVDGVRYAVKDLFEPGPILILGRGGAAKAAIYAFRDRELSVYCRDHSKDDELRRIKDDLRIVCDFNELEFGQATNVIQATTVGFREDRSLLKEALPGQKTLFDMIYTPWETSIMRNLKGSGVQLKNGYEMVLGQAEKCFKLFSENRI